LTTESKHQSIQDSRVQSTGGTVLSLGVRFMTRGSEDSGLGTQRLSYSHILSVHWLMADVALYVHCAHVLGIELEFVQYPV
jgi:hypothetical protein